MDPPWPRSVRDLPYNFDPLLSITRHAAPDYVDSSDPPLEMSSEQTLDGHFMPSSPPKAEYLDVDMDGDDATDDDEVSGAAHEATLRHGSITRAARSESSLRHRTPAEVINEAFDSEAKAAAVDLAGRGLRRVPVECRDLAVHVDLVRTHSFLLDLKSNAIGLVDRYIYKIERLEFLSLRSNELTELSPLIGRLTHLRELHVGHNFLKTLPAELLAMPELRVLTTYPNPFLPQPASQASELRWISPIPSLTELTRRALASTAKSDFSNVERLLRMVDGSLRMQLEQALETAYAGRVCSQCRSLVIVPAAIYLEWKQHARDSSGETVPFQKSFCSVNCVRRARASHVI